MSKVKMHRSTPSIDMTPMVDLAFLLVTFFMLTATAVPDEPVQVSTPSSVSEFPIPETNVITITISKENRIYFNIDGQYTRARILNDIGSKYNIAFTEEEKHDFAVMSSFGIPIGNLKEFLSLDREARKKIEQPGIPADSLHNELSDWVITARLNNPRAVIAIKGDSEVGYPTVKKVINTLLDKKVHKFNLITSDEKLSS